MPKVSNNRITFDATDFLQTLAPQYSTSLSGSPEVQGGNKLSSAVGFNPYRYNGYAAPGFNPTNATNHSEIAIKLLNGVVAYESSTAYAYMIELGDQLHQMTLSTSTISNSSPWPHTISGSGVITGSDVITYTISSTNYLFYSYNDAGAAWDIGRYDLDGSTFDDDWFTTVPTGTFSTTGNTDPHPMVVGSDDILYIGDGNVLHAYDGATDTISEAVLTLPVKYKITCFARLPNYLVVFAYLEPRSGSLTSTFELSVAKAFAWDYLSLDPTFIYELSDNFVSEAFEYKGTVGCFTQGRLPINDGENRYSKLKIFDGAIFETVQQFIGNAPVHGGAVVVGDAIQWNSDGLLHQYGSPFEGNPIGLNKIGRATTTGTSTQTGMCKVFDQRGTYISAGASPSTTGNALIRFATATFAANTSVSTVIGSPEFPEGQIGRVKSVTVYFGTTATGGRSLSLLLAGNDTSSTTIIDTETEVAAGALTQKFEYDTSDDELPKFQDLKLILQWGAGSGSSAAPIIKKVVVEYEHTNIESN